MQVPEILFQLQQPIDVTSSMVQLLSRNGGLSDTAATLNVEVYQVPADKVLVLTGSVGRADPGAGQVAQRITFYYYDDPGSSTQLAYSRAPASEFNIADLSIQHNCGHCAWMPPGATIGMQGNFDAGVNANLIQFAIHGILIPRGNIQQG